MKLMCIKLVNYWIWIMGKCKFTVLFYFYACLKFFIIKKIKLEIYHPDNTEAYKTTMTKTTAFSIFVSVLSLSHIHNAENRDTKR